MLNGIEQSKNFHTRIAKVCPPWVENIELSGAGMNRAGGYGQYQYFLEGSINGEYFYFTKPTTDSQTWDWYVDCEPNRAFSNWVKAITISLLEQKFETM